MKKLRNKLLVYILFPVLLILTVTATLSYLAARGMLVKKLAQVNMLGLRLAEDEVDVAVCRGIEILRTLAIQQRSVNLDKEDLESIFQGLAEQHPLESFFMVFPDGRRIITMPKLESRLMLKDVRSQDWYKQALASNDVVYSDPRVSDILQQSVITAAMKVVDQKGGLRSVVGYDMPLQLVRDKLEKIGTLMKMQSKGIVFSVFLNDGRYLIRTGQHETAKRLTDSEEDLHLRMWGAVKAGEADWSSAGTMSGQDWVAGFRKSKFGGFYLAFEAPLADAMRPVRNMTVRYAALAVVCLMVISGILLLMARKMIKPVKMLTGAAVRLNKGDYDLFVPVITKDELGNLTTTFNSMIQGLRQRDFIKDTFGRYLDHEVVNRLLASKDGLKLGGEKREVSILMSDLRGFTALTAGMPPERTIAVLNRYLEKMLERLLEYRATIDEIVGDGILAIFGAPEYFEDHPARAVACALAMQMAMEGVNAMNEMDGLPPLEMGIAVNTGEVVVGNIGSEKRTKYGVVGAEVNFTGRVESYTVGGQVLITESTFKRTRIMVQVRDVMTVEMKGLQGPVTLYDLQGIGAPYEIRLGEALRGPDPVKKKIAVRIRGMDKKILKQREVPGWITHLSDQGAIIALAEEIPEMGDIKIALLDHEMKGSLGQAYGKIVRMRHVPEGFEATVRFTSISPDVRRIFRHPLSEQQ